MSGRILITPRSLTSGPHPQVERLHAAGFEVVTSSPEQFAAFTRSEILKWGKLVKATGLKAD